MTRPKKNIHPVLADIRHPKKKAAVLFDWKPNKVKFAPKNKKSIFKKITGFIFFGLVLGVFLYGAQIWNFKNEAYKSISSIAENFKNVGKNMMSLEPDSASASLSNIDLELKNLNRQASFLELVPVLSEVPEVISEIQELTGAIILLNNDMAEIKSKGFGLVFNSDGENDGKFLALLINVHSNLQKLSAVTSSLRNRVLKYKSLPDDINSQYFELSTYLARATDGLGSVINLLKKPGENHFIVIFENPSEIRPGGGFVGSYADLTVENGAIKNIDVNDIYYPDRFSDLKIKPPKQLQTVTTEWGARDANWFFNFPTSAGKIIEFLEESNIYKDKDVKFDGVIAVNVKLMEDILKIIGPIEVSEYGLTLNDENFLREVQKEVEEGRDKKPGQNPKKILSVITPIVLERIHGLNDAGKAGFFNTLLSRVRNKDIKFYFKDKEMQNIAVQSNVAGEVFSLPSDFKGDYLAVVNTNVASGKSDVFIDQAIKLSSRIDENGTITNDLTVSRSHRGQDEKDWWYRSTNKNFIKIFTPPDTELRTMSGNASKNIKAPIDYVKKGYVIDKDLSSIEDTGEYLSEFKTDVYEESGKNVFATWFNIEAAEAKDLSLSYDNPNKLSLAEGNKYQFVLDKQSGVLSKFDYILEAPPGFKWKEADDFIFHYRIDDVPARLVINLTLQKI